MMITKCRVVMEKVKKYTQSGERLDEFSMVFYNNLLSLCVLFTSMMNVIGSLSE